MFESKIEDRFRAYFLRVGYVRTMEYTAPPLSYPLPDLVCRTFLPVFKATNHYENITELLARVEFFVTSTSITLIVINKDILDAYLFLGIIYQKSPEGESGE